MEPIVYLPVEIKYREMPSRLLVASHLLQAGYAVMIGNHWAMATVVANQAALPPGLFFFKSANKLQGMIMQSLRQHGHSVAASDEEVLVFTEYNGYTVAFAKNAAAACELFFAQSEAHREAVERRFPHLAGKVKVAGNPRIDLMLPKNRSLFEAVDDRVAPLRPYILFNTNYGTINSVWGDRERTVAEGTGAFDDDDPNKKEEGRSKYTEYLAIRAWEESNREAMVALIKWALAEVSLNVVVRPHPAELPAYWQNVLGGSPKGHLIPRSDPHPWILGAKLVVHTGCTTGLEALLLDRPVLNLLPRNHPNCGQIVREANATVRNAEDAQKAMAAYLLQRQGPIADHGERARAALERHLPSYKDDAAARLMAEGLVEELQKRGAPPRKDFKLNWRGQFTAPERNVREKDKYTATEDEVGADLAKAIAAAGLSVKAKLSTVCEGLFLATPV
ncbi:MAG: surface carbohydrate biosynthesis protein [Rhodospirillaceae bacterium]